jgi:hypothetical protein
MVDFEQKGYVQEKAEFALKAIVSVVEELERSKEVIPADVFMELKEGLRVALFDSTKVVAFLHDCVREQNWTDVDLILEKGGRGLNEVLFKYGCIPEPGHMKKDRERPPFVRRVLELAKRDRGESRNAIYLECEKFAPDPLEVQIRNLLEGVTQNTKEWTQFQCEIDELLPAYLENSGSA